MNDKSKISKKVLKVEKSIEKEDKIKVLQSWYDNIKNYAGITEYEREYLVDAVEKKIRVKFPNKAKKISVEFIKWWCPRTDSNRGPIDYKSIIN